MRDRSPDGDEEFVRFAAARRTRLYRTAFLLCGERHAAEDLLQQTLERTFVAWHRVSRADEPDAYVRRIMLNEHSRRFRRQHRESLVTEVPEPRESAGAGADWADWADNRTALLSALAALPSRPSRPSATSAPTSPRSPSTGPTAGREPRAASGWDPAALDADAGRPR